MYNKNDILREIRKVLLEGEQKINPTHLIKDKYDVRKSKGLKVRKFCFFKG